MIPIIHINVNIKLGKVTQAQVVFAAQAGQRCRRADEVPKKKRAGLFEESPAQVVEA